MQPYLALIGGEEFAEGFETVHAGLLADAPGKRVVFLPTCAADDGDEALEYWRKTAREKFSALGASVEAPRVVDTSSANDETHARLVADADLIYFGGGYPHVAMRILPNTRVLEAARAAMKRGAIIAGSSGGAMLMCAHSFIVTPEHAADLSLVWEKGSPPDWDPPMPPPVDGLNLIPRSSCAPHFDRVFPAGWLKRGHLPKGVTLIGIDEQTALARTPKTNGQWEVRGRGGVTIIGSDMKRASYRAGERISLTTGD